MSTSDLHPTDGENGSDAIPSWILANISTDPANVSMREVMTMFLFQASRESILIQARLTITPEHLVSCSPTYGFALFQLLITKGIQVPAPSAVDEEEGIQAVV